MQVGSRYRSAVESNAETVTSFRDQVLFSGWTTIRDFELWMTDGTTDGTRLLKNISEDTSSIPDLMFADEREAFFTADDGVHGRELWRTDGTSEGTRVVEDLTPGPVGSFVITLLADFELTRRGNAIVFWACRNLEECGLWSKSLEPDEDARPFFLTYAYPHSFTQAGGCCTSRWTRSPRGASCG